MCTQQLNENVKISYISREAFMLNRNRDFSITLCSMNLNNYSQRLNDSSCKISYNLILLA